MGTIIRHKGLKRLFAIVVLCLAFSGAGRAAVAEAQPEIASSAEPEDLHEVLSEAEAAVDVKGIVQHHLGDTYWWHIWGDGQREVDIPLPVIVRSRNGEWSVFSSSRLMHGAEYKGFRISHGGKYGGKLVESDGAGGEMRPLDLSFTRNALGIFINCGLLLLLVLPLARWYRRGNTSPPRGVRGAVEMLVWSIEEQVVRPCVGRDYKRFSPYLLTAFFFIFLTNIMGLIPFFPGGANITGNIAVTLLLALCTFLAVNIFGTKEYWREILWPDVPTWLKVPIPLMPAIELFGIFTKPFALMIRLFANIMAGHAVILGLVCVIFVTASMGAAVNAGMSVLSVVFGIFMNLVELLVAYIQAYVFTLLSAVFIGMARERHEGSTSS